MTGGSDRDKDNVRGERQRQRQCEGGPTETKTM